MDRRFTPPKRVTSPTWGTPPPCIQALSPLCATGSVLRRHALWDCSGLCLTATKTSLKNVRRPASNFIALNISSRSIRQMLIISGVEFVKTVWFVQLQTYKFQGFFKDKLQFSRTNIYSIINRHSLNPFWTHHWLKHVMHVIFFKQKIKCCYVTRELYSFFHRGWDRFSSAK